MKKFVVSLLLTSLLALPLFGQESPPVTYTLEECVDISLKRSPAVLSAEQEMRRASGVVWETWSDIVSVDLSAQYISSEAGERSTGLSSLSGLGGTGIGRSTGFTTGFGGSVTIFSGGRVINGILSAYLGRDLAREQYLQAVNDTVYSVISSFDQILLDRELVKVSKEQVDFLTQTYDSTKTKYDSGMASWYELLRTQVDLTNAEPALLDAEDALASDTDNLKKILGVDVGQPLEIEGELVYRDASFSLDDCLAKASVNNPGLLVASTQEDIARKQVRIVIGQYFPTISLFGTYEFTSDQPNVSFNSDEWDFIGGITASMPITDLVGISARLKQARALLEEAKISRKDTENGIRAQVKKAYKDFTRSKKVVESQKQNIVLAKEGLDIAVVQYDNGINTYLDLINARLALTQANLNYINAVYNYLDALARLEDLMGERPEGGTVETEKNPDGVGAPSQ